MVSRARATREMASRARAIVDSLLGDLSSAMRIWQTLTQTDMGKTKSPIPRTASARL